MQIKYYTRYFIFMVSIGIIGFSIVSCSRLGGQYSMHDTKTNTRIDTKDNSRFKIPSLPDLLPITLKKNLIKEVKNSNEKEFIKTHLNKLYTKFLYTAEQLNQDIKKVESLLVNINHSIDDSLDNSIEFSSTSSVHSLSSSKNGFQNDDLLSLYVELLVDSNILVDFFPETKILKCTNILSYLSASVFFRYYKMMLSKNLNTRNQGYYALLYHQDLHDLHDNKV